MKTKAIITCICILCLTLTVALCGCKDKDVNTTESGSYVHTNPPDYGTEGTPEEDGVIMGEQEEGESLVPPSLTAPEKPY